jgi:hypothetical protein
LQRKPSRWRFCRLDCAGSAQRLVAAEPEAAAPFQRAALPSIGSLLISKANIGVAAIAA